MIKHTLTLSATLTATLATAFALAACGGGGAGSMVTATTAIKTTMSSDTQIRPKDLELSCDALELRLTNLQTRYDELAAEQKKKQRGKSLFTGLVNSTIGIFGGVAAVGTGTAQGVQAVSTATHAAGMAADDLINSESDSESLRAIGEMQPIAERMVQLSKAKFEKDCE